MDTNMSTKGKFGLLGIALVLTVVVLLAGRAFLTGYQPVEGRVLEKLYTPSSSSVGVGSVNVNGQPGSVTTVNVRPEKFILLVEANDTVDSYSVTAVTYARVQVGDPIWLNCNANTCGVIEE